MFPLSFQKFKMDSNGFRIKNNEVKFILGKAVPVEEQVDVKTAAMASDPAASPDQAVKDQAAMQSSFIGLVSGGVSAIPEAEKAQMEEEKKKLYEQLDDKVSELLSEEDSSPLFASLYSLINIHYILCHFC